MSKHDLRRLMKDKLLYESKSLSERSLKLSKNLKQLISELNSTFIGKSTDEVTRLNLGGFIPMMGEPQWQVEFSDDDEIDFSLVHMISDIIKLNYHQVSLDSIVKREHGRELDEHYLAKSVTPEMILVPGLAFNRKGERLGRGRAYFDSFLSGFEGISIGVFHSFQEVENVFCEAHDEKLNFIVTDKEIIRGI